jgi:antitoxin (DNA-binding transcriptional repressor) of toxin-antitoxin stability system
MSDIKLPRRLDLSVQYACNRDGVPSRVEFRRWLRAAEPGAARITVRIVDEDEGRELNRDYRGKDYATNVLTFAYGEGEDMPLPEGLPLMGDLVLCRQVVEREAAEQGKPWTRITPTYPCMVCCICRVLTIWKMPRPTRWKPGNARFWPAWAMQTRTRENAER